jgi:hypothetical protein
MMRACITPPHTHTHPSQAYTDPRAVSVVPDYPWDALGYRCLCNYTPTATQPNLQLPNPITYLQKPPSSNGS